MYISNLQYPHPCTYVPDLEQILGIQNRFTKNRAESEGYIGHKHIYAFSILKVINYLLLLKLHTRGHIALFFLFSFSDNICKVYCIGGLFT